MPAPPTQLGTVINAFDTEWVGLLQEQLPLFLSGWVDETVRNRMLLAELRRRGRIVLGQTGPQCIWSVKYRQHQVRSRGDAGELTFDRTWNKMRVGLNWRGYYASDMMTEKEYLMNRGPGQIYDRYGEQIPDMMEAMSDNFGGELILDGEASGRSNNIHGIESFLGAAGGTLAADLIALPSDTYAGQSTALANLSGSWSATLATKPSTSHTTDWPSGKGTTDYDFYSPKLINWSSTGWGTGSTTWESNCERAIRQTKIWLSHTGGKAGTPTLLLCSQDLYAGYLNHMAAKQRLIVDSRATEMGFDGAYTQEGVTIFHDYDVPADTAYMLNLEMMELASLDQVLFGYRGPEFSIKDGGWLTRVGFWGNARYRPKHFAKLYPYA